MFKRMCVWVVLCAAGVGMGAGMLRAEDVKPLKVLLLAGGCCHDYAKQKDILKAGIEARANAIVDVVYSTDTNTKPNLSVYGNPDYAKGYDVVIHDECSADINTEAVVDAILKPHRDGTPAVVLHCGMHCYRIGSPNDTKQPDDSPHNYWFHLLGLQSSGHNWQKPIAISYTDKEHAITKGFEDWTTVNEELYNNVKIFETCHPLAHGKQTQMQGKDKEKKEVEVDTVVVWTNEYTDKKTRVFCTTIGHNNTTVGDPRYLDLVTRGMLWACDKLNDTYLKKPVAK